MGAKQSQLTPSDVSQLLHSTDLSEQEIKEFHKDFLKTYPKGRLTKQDVAKLYKKTYPKGDPAAVVDELFRVYDSDKDGTVDFREFLVGIGAAQHATEEQKLKLAFQIFDADASGYISNSEMHALIRAIYKAQAYGKYDEKVADTVGSLMFQQMDKNRDNKITLNEFVEGAKNDPSVARLLKLDVCCQKK